MKSLEGKKVRSVIEEDSVTKIETMDGIVYSIDSALLGKVTSEELPISRQCLDCIWFRPKKPYPCGNNCNPFSKQECEGKITQEDLDQTIEFIDLVEGDDTSE